MLHVLFLVPWQNEGSTDTSDAAELGLANVGGVFMVLTTGLIVAALIALCEFAWKSRKLAIHKEGGVLKEMCLELNSAIRYMTRNNWLEFFCYSNFLLIGSCSGNTKPVRRLEWTQLRIRSKLGNVLLARLVIVWVCSAYRCVCWLPFFSINNKRKFQIQTWQSCKVHVLANAL